MEEISTDLRAWPAGGWAAAKTRVKTNGRWFYFYQPEDATPWNSREPVAFTATYRPPNHEHDPFQAYPDVPTHPTRQRLLDASRPARAPYSFPTGERQRALIPPAARNSLLVPPQTNEPEQGQLQIPMSKTLIHRQSPEQPDPPKPRRMLQANFGQSMPVLPIPSDLPRQQNEVPNLTASLSIQASLSWVGPPAVRL
jgi:hypothetical protein